VILGPNDPRALRPTGRTWERDGFSGPVMVDGAGDEHECFSGSVADIGNGKLDEWFARPGGPVERLVALLGGEDDEGVTFDLT
jgi:hypothetical protein